MRRRIFAAASVSLFTVLLSAGPARAETITRVADINPGSASSGSSGLTLFDDDLYFIANHLPHGRDSELWRYDGATVERVADVYPGDEGSGITDLTVVGETLYFSAREADTAMKLFQFDGTSHALAPDAAASNTPQDLVAYDGQLMYRASHFDPPNSGIELWRFDGAQQHLLDLYPGSGSSYPQQFVEYQGDLYFNGGSRMWRYNHGQGAVLVDATINPRHPAVFDGALYFSHYDGVHGNELWRYTPSGGAEMAADIIPGGQYDSGNPSFMTPYNGYLFFSATSSEEVGNELWRFDGNVAEMVADINPLITTPGHDPIGDSWPMNFFEFDDKLYFSANDGTHGTELWSYDPIGGVRMVADINPGQYGSNPSGFVVYQGRLHFSANDGTTGGELTELGSEALFQLITRPTIAFTGFSEPPLDADGFTPGPGDVELGFQTVSSPSGGQNPMVAVKTTSTTPTSPILAHRSVEAVTTFDTVDLSGWEQVEATIRLQVRDTTYETGDYLRVYVTNQTDEIDLFHELGAGNDGLDRVAGTGYHAYGAMIPDAWAEATLVIGSYSNSSAAAERFDFDDVEFRGLEIVTPAQVTGRHLLYGNSAFDDVAPDKQPLRPGQQASLANVTSFTGGVNGVIVDVDGLVAPGLLGAFDFEFKVGNNDDPSTWVDAPDPDDVTVLEGLGADGADRVVITWDDGQIVRQWLQVTMLVNGRTGLAEADVFYFGSAVGETGNRANDAMVTAADLIAVRDHPRGPGNRAGIANPFDVTRDGLVDATDMLAVRNAATSPFTALRLIDLSVAPAPQAVPEPTSAALALIGLLVVLARRRRGCPTP